MGNRVSNKSSLNNSWSILGAQQDQGKHSQGQQQGGQQGLLQQQLPGQIQGEPAWLCCVCLKCFRRFTADFSTISLSCRGRSSI